MPKLFQINVVANSGSTGKIAEQIGILARNNGWDCYMAYGRWAYNSSLRLYRIGTKKDIYLHGLKSILFDRHALGSKKATKALINEIQLIKPDIIHIHNIHGYYLNLPLLCDFLSKYGRPIVMTLHDCWTVTGHCVHFQDIGCDKWKNGCHHCPNLKGYPRSLLIDNSKNNWRIKKDSFQKILPSLTIVPVCNWLGDIVSQSYLQKANRKVIVNGIDLEIFKPMPSISYLKSKYKIDNKFVILSVSNGWNSTKGFEDILWLRDKLSDEFIFVMVGVSPKQKKKLPKGIIGVCRTENVSQLAELYSMADVFLNPTYQDTLPTVSIEALACGTPVIGYNTGGSADIIDENVGMLIERGNKEKLLSSIQNIKCVGKDSYRDRCREKALSQFNNQNCYQNYLDLYNDLLKEQAGKKTATIRNSGK